MIMEQAAIVKELEAKYPGARIKQLPPETPSEIVCEYNHDEGHPDWSLAVAVIDRSAPHYHKVMTEIYRILRGSLTLHVNDEVVILNEGDEYTVVPGTVHWAQGDATWVEVECRPAYSQSDHILV